MPHSSRTPGSSQERPRRSTPQGGGRMSSRQPSSGGRGWPRDPSLAGSPAGVRRQAGRRPRRQNLWPRRIITGLGLLTVLGLILWALISTLTWALGGADAAQSAPQSGQIDPNSPRMSADGLITSADSVQIPECTAEMLAINSTVGSIRVGQTLTAAVTVSAQPNVACSTSAGMFALVVTSGDQLYYDSRRCEGYDPSAGPLLLSPTASWNGELSWDARRYNGCSPVDSNGDGAADNAEPGTYKIRVMYGEHNTSSEHVIEVSP